MGFKKAFIFMAAAYVLFLFGCGPSGVAPIAALDTPEHHVANGNKFLKAGKITDARAEFSRAVALDPKFSPGYLGLGLVYGHDGEYAKGLANQKTARKLAKNNPQKVAALVGIMRLYLMGGENFDARWLDKIQYNHIKAITIAPKNPEPYFYMGEGYKKAYRLRDAVEQYSKVLDINRGFVEEADKAYFTVQKIERARPGSDMGKTIAFMDTISRADMAALLIQELAVDEIFKKQALKKENTAFKNPQQFAAEKNDSTVEAIDIAGHILKADIDAILKMGIKGLAMFPDLTFKPDTTISRAEFAMMMEDIFIKITRDSGLATQFIGYTSAFPDVRNDLPYFNAVMVCTTRNIMAVRDIGTGRFEPLNPVSGAEALLSMRMLKTQLNKY